MSRTLNRRQRKQMNIAKTMQYVFVLTLFSSSMLIHVSKAAMAYAGFASFFLFVAMRAWIEWLEQ